MGWFLVGMTAYRREGKGREDKLDEARPLTMCFNCVVCVRWHAGVAGSFAVDRERPTAACSVRVWAASTGKETHRLSGHLGGIR